MAQLKVSQNVARKLAEIARSMGGGAVEVGFLEGATYGDGTPVAFVAYEDEFGHGGKFPSPPRPFFRTMIKKEAPSWPGKMAALAKATNYEGPQVLKFMGEDIEGALKQSIIETNEPALSPTTLALRAKFGNNPQDIRITDVLAAKDAVRNKTATLASGTQAKPLVWTGHMLNSTGYRVIT